MKLLLYGLSGLWLALLCSCDRSEMDKEKSSTRVFTQQEYEALGKRIEKKINGRSYDTLNKVLDIAYMVEKIIPQLSSPTLIEEFRQIKVKKGTSAFYKEFDWARNVALAVAQNHGKYEFVRFHKKDNVPHLLLRLTTDAGFTYHDYETRTIDDHLRFTDVYVYNTGEYLSRTLEDMAIRMEEITRKEQQISVVGKMQEMKKRIDDNDFSGALQLYESLPALSRKSKMLMVYKLSITAGLKPDLYQKTLEEYKKLFPGDPSLPLVNLDGHFAKQEYDKTLECIAQLDKQVGGDAYLDLIRTNIYYAKGERNQAVELVERYIQSHPKDTQGYWKKFEILSAEQKDAEAIEVLNEIDRKTMYSRRMITYYVETKYPDFAILSCFQDWKEKWIARYQEKNSWKLKKKHN